jgi:hypothetical protein
VCPASVAHHAHFSAFLSDFNTMSSPYVPIIRMNTPNSRCRFMKYEAWVSFGALKPDRSPPMKWSNVF